MHVTELIFVVDFEGRTLRGNCQLHFSRSREATQVELQQWLKVEEVTSEGSRLDFHIVEEDTTQKCLVEAPFGADEFQLQIQFVVVPGSPALWWHQEDQLLVAKQAAGRALLPRLAPATPHSAPCTLSLYVPVGMMVVACGRLHEPADGKTIEGYQPFTFMVDQAALEDLAFAAGDLQVDQGSFGLLVGQSHTPFGSFLAAKEELELVLESLKEALAYVVTPLEAGALGMNSLQVAVLPDQSLPHGGFGLPGLMMLPASLVPCDQGSMSHLVALHLVEVVLGSCQKGQDRCILRGLIALVWQRLMSQVHGNGGDFLQCLPWRWMEQAEPEGRFTPASQALFSWLLRCETISSAELDDFISQLLLRSREGQISEEELSATTRRCLPGLAQGSWPSVSSCQEKLNAHRRWLQGATQGVTGI